MNIDQLGDLFGPRQMRNCLPCKKRKIKCDRKIPCGPCALRRDIKSCTPALGRLEEIGGDVATVPSTDGYVSTREFQLLARKVEALQDKVQELEASVSSRGPRPPVSSTSAAVSPAPQAKIMSRRHMADDEMVYALEDFHGGHRINAMRNISDSPEITTVRFGSGDGGHDVTTAPADVTDDHPLSFVITPGTDYLAKALALLPDRPTCELLVNQYFENVEWFQRCLHYPSFMHQCRQFWTAPPPTSQLSPDFICTYIMVICLGLRMVVTNLPGMHNAPALADQLYHVAEGVLWCSRFLYRQTFESLQAISLMTIYGFGMEDGADATWALLGSAVKMAQNLGMNRLEAEAADKVWSPVWNTRMRREMGRRVWWTFVSLDWAHAIAHGSTYVVHPSQNLTALPLNVEEELLDDPNAQPQPLSTYTNMSMHIFRFKFVQMYREITDHTMTHQNPSYQFVLAMDDSIIELARNLPKHFGDPSNLPGDSSPSLVLDSIFLNITANIRLIRLHRPYLLRGYQDVRYLRSKERCVSASQTVLQLIELATHRAPVLLGFWTVLFYAFSAAVPVVIDHLFEPTDEKRQSVLQILATFREHTVLSPAARKSVFVLERLLEVENQFRDPATGESSTKRRRGDNGPEAALSPGTLQADELLRSTIRNILERATQNESAQQRNMPLPVMGMAALQQAEAFSDLGSSDTLGLDNMWAPSFDILDTLWTQTENAWPAQ
ncbi:hypothetical protein CspeluHIS016_0500680 [Cutaneotrichosporon spelunceum]|uniref:Zn(2)-C6 fungal-type domain-containing protein n=1 Tax=Cutaneotrichosporon spelunceum TaxID=1672016 RepID=A0AAD3TWU0_9TREE|nr:hypothetical protein CspeluHIS016_0500680 [Cutaneotrichosporon spelunceum]